MRLIAQSASIILPMILMACGNSEINKAKQAIVSDNFTAEQLLDYEPYCDDTEWELKQDAHKRNYVIHTCTTTFGEGFIDDVIYKLNIERDSQHVQGFLRTIKSEIEVDKMFMKDLQSSWESQQRCRDSQYSTNCDDPLLDKFFAVTFSEDFLEAKKQVFADIDKTLAMIEADKQVLDGMVEDYIQMVRSTYKPNDKYYRVTQLLQDSYGEYNLTENLIIADDHGNEDQIRHTRVGSSYSRFYQGESRSNLAKMFNQFSKVATLRVPTFEEWAREILNRDCDELGNQDCPISSLYSEGRPRFEDVVRSYKILE